MKTKTWAIIVSLLLAVCSDAYSAGNVPPPRYPVNDSPPSTLKSAPSSSLMLGNVVVTFDKTNLGEVLKKMNSGEIQLQGDAGESSYWLCYSNHTTEGWEQLWLLSHGEMGGDEHTIHGVVAKKSAAFRPSASCPELISSQRPVKLNNGLWLGTKTEDVIQKLGKPSLQTAKWIHYKSRRELIGDPRAKDFGTDKIIELGGLSIRAKNGKVVEIWATLQTD